MKTNLLVVLQNYLKTKFIQNKFTSRKELEKWQDKQVKKFLKRILPKSKFYSERFKDYDLSSWRIFPPINKNLMMDNFDNLNTVGISKEKAFEIALEAEKSRDFSPTLNNVTIGLSSGTSGNRGIFLASDHERSAWAGLILAKLLPSSIFSKDKQKIAFFLRANSNLYDSLDRGKISFQFFDLLENIGRHVDRLNEYQPTILVAPPSMLLLLAKHSECGHLVINPVKVVSVAEVLESTDREYIEEQFRQKVHQVYQCTEGFLGTTCEHGTLHINEDMLVVQKEYIDKKNGRFTPIITDFTRTSQPIIRYRLNDILKERTTPCPCGSIYLGIESIEGRSDDMFYFYETGSENLKPIFPDFIRRTILTASPNIKEYKVIQIRPKEVEVHIELPSQHEKNIEELITKSFENFCSTVDCQTPHVKLFYNINHDFSKKLRRIERKFSV